MHDLLHQVPYALCGRTRKRSCVCDRLVGHDPFPVVEQPPQEFRPVLEMPVEAAAGYPELFRKRNDLHPLDPLRAQDIKGSMQPVFPGECVSFRFHHRAVY